MHVRSFFTHEQIDALGQIIGGPIIGLIALKTSICICGNSVSGYNPSDLWIKFTRA